MHFIMMAIMFISFMSELGSEIILSKSHINQVKKVNKT